MALLEHLGHLISAELEKWNVPGLTIAVLDSGEIERAAFGLLNLETGVRSTPDSLFQIGSISKIFTTSLLLTLLDEGKVNLDTPVKEYISELQLSDRETLANLTPRHLITHLSGIWGDRFDDHGNGDDALALAVTAMADLPQQTPLGETFTYCNAGFDIAGRLIEKVTGQTFETAMKERIWEPIGLSIATYFPAEAILHSVAVGHVEGEDGGMEVATPWPIPRRSNPAGGISTNVAELITFGQFHLNDGKTASGKQVLKPSTAEMMRQTQTSADYGRNWGLGWWLREVDGLEVVEHTGSTNGFCARLTLVPGRQFAIAQLSNGVHGNQALADITALALKEFLGLSIEPVKTKPLKTAQRDNIVGNYKSGLAEIEITADGDRTIYRQWSINPFSGDRAAPKSGEVEQVEKDVLQITTGDFIGTNIEVLRDKKKEIRFLRIGLRLAFPVASSK